MKKCKELAEALIEMLEENMKLRIKIDRVCNLLEEFNYKKNSKEDTIEFIDHIIYYLQYSEEDGGED